MYIKKKEIEKKKKKNFNIHIIEFSFELIS